MSDMTLMMRILANGTGLRMELGKTQNMIRSFTGEAKQQFHSLGRSINSVMGLAGIGGASYGVMQLAKSSAMLDKTLMQIGQTAGASRMQIVGLRKDLYAMAKDSGQGVEELREGFNSLVQSGLKMEEAKETLDGINIAMAVTGSNARTLAAGLTVGAQAFKFDLTKPGMALTMLDKMTVAGRLGNAELENLSDIFARVGVNAASAGMSFDKTLAFIETLSLIERQPERVAVLADSTLRLFTNLNYMKNAQKATGIKFFDEKGSRRDAMAILADIKKKYDTLKSDAERSQFIFKAFGKADLDTIKGLRTLLQGDMITKSSQFASTITNASGTLEKDLNDATDNLIDQAGRLKSTMKEAADEFVKPVNETIANFIKFMMDKREKGGLELTGKEMAIGAATIVGGTYVAATLGKWAVEALKGKKAAKIPGLNNLGGLASTATGIAEGLALKQIGVTPVFVTNWPAGGLGGGNLPLLPVPTTKLPGKGIPLPPILTGGGSLLGTLGTNALIGSFAALNAGSIAAAFAAAPVMASSLVAASGAVGYGLGTGINNMPNLWGGRDISETIADALFEALHRDDNKKPELNNNISITIDRNDRAFVESRGSSKTNVKTNTGSFMEHLSGGLLQ